MDIFDAIVKRDICRLYEMLKKSNNIQNKLECDDITPLHFAVSYNFPEAVSLLLKFVADYNKKNLDGLTLVDYAKQFNYSTIISLFDSVCGVGQNRT